MKRQALVVLALVASTSASVRVFRGPCSALPAEVEQPPTAVHPLAGTIPQLCVAASTLASIPTITRQSNWTEVLPPAGAPDAFLIRAVNHAAQQQVVEVAGESAVARLADQWFVAFGAAELADGMHLCNVQLLGPATGILPPTLHSARNITSRTAAKDDIVNSLNGDELFSRLEELSGEKDARIGDEVKRIMTRQSWAANNLDAANYIKQWFDTEGAVDESYLQPFSSSGRNSRNVVGIRYGTTRRDEIVVVGGHFDSTSEQASTYAPGAVDDGSGTLAVLQAVKAFRGYAPTRTIHFVAFSGEEQGLIGSNYYVSNAVNNGWNIVSAVLLDMTAYSYNYYGVIIEGTTNSAIQDLMRRVEQNTLTYSPKLTVAKSNNSFGSDHVPFQRAGIPAVLLIEQDDTNYPGYHRTTDRVSYVNRDQANDIHRGMVGTIYDLAFV